MKTNIKRDTAIIIGVIVVFAYLVWAIQETQRQWRVMEMMDRDGMYDDYDPLDDVPNFDY